MNQTQHKKKKVLIISEEFDLSTCEVMEWIDYLGADCKRINSENFASANLGVNLSLNFEKGCQVQFRHGDTGFSTTELDAVWYRRDPAPDNVQPVKGIAQAELKRDINQHYYSEVKEAKRSLMAALASGHFLGDPYRPDHSKWQQLMLARACGLDVPATLITDNGEQIEDFRRQYGRIICKAISNTRFFDLKDGVHVFSLYTNEVKAEQMKHYQSPQLTLVQEMLDKDVELRIFYLDGQCFSMAIFSQLDQQTEVDFRRYNQDVPNRNVPFSLPENVEASVVRFMKAIGLNTGSVDIVKTRDNRYVFLEVNPVGQFGMTSKPCNFQIEKKIAQYLLQ